MLCEYCGKNEANVHITKNINGHVTELNLCSECARKTGNMPDMHMGSLFSDFFSSVMPARARRYAHIPESAVNEYAGCEDCLEDGKQDAGSPDLTGEKTTAEKISGLKEKLKDAVAKEEYEEAAKLRDEIRALEQEPGVE